MSFIVTLRTLSDINFHIHVYHFYSLCTNLSSEMVKNFPLFLPYPLVYQYEQALIPVKGKIVHWLSNFWYHWKNRNTSFLLQSIHLNTPQFWDIWKILEILKKERNDQIKSKLKSISFILMNQVY